MLTVDTRSWHYRLIKWARIDPIPKNLCSYFWVIVGIFAVPLMMLASFGVLVAVYISLIIDWTWWALLGPLVLVVMMAAVVVLCVTLGIIIGSIHWMYRRWRPRAEVGASTLGLVKAYVSARKRKICPLIEVKDV